MRRALGISLAMHALFLLGLVLSGTLASHGPLVSPVYRINLIAAPRGETLRPARERPRPRSRDDTKPASAPKPEPEIKEPEKEVVPDKTAKPVLKVKPRPDPATKGPDEKPAPPPETPPALTPESGGNDAALDVDIEGKPFPFPDYLDRMVNKIGRYWKETPNREPLRAVVTFRVERGGRVRGIEVFESSGSFLFDQAAIRAVSDASPLPPLPAGFSGDFLPVQFYFDERNR
ncbi:MAG TPA: energy transducer TonB [Gemmatimonadota bacterium]|jgi:protein TonB